MNNRPGLDTLAVRVATFGGMRRALLDRIAHEPALAALTTRASDDFAVTVIELMAAVADVLSFYSERLTTEFYLPTARDRASLLRLARLIGYEPAPGYAATTLLRFGLDAGARLRVRRGFPVMSMPGPDEHAQTFETLAELIADARLDDVALTAPPVPAARFAAGTVYFTATARPASLAPGDGLVLFADGVVEEKKLVAVQPLAVGERLVLAPPVMSNGLATGRLMTVAKSLRFFGAGSAASAQVYDTRPEVAPAQRWRTEPVDLRLAVQDQFLPLESRIADLAAGAAVLLDAGPGAVLRLATALATAVEDGPATLQLVDMTVPQVALTDTVTRVRLFGTVRGRPAIAIGTNRPIAAVRGGAGGLIATGNGARAWAADVAGDPALVSPKPGRVDLFARAGGGSLLHAVWQDGKWTELFSIDAPLVGDPVGLALPSGALFALAQGIDGGLWSRQIEPESEAWQPLGGSVTARPAAVALPTGEPLLLIRGADRGLWSKRGELPWERLGGVLASGPAAVAAGGGADVVACDAAGAVIHRRWDGQRWSAWATLGGTGLGTPAIVASGADRVEVVAPGRDGVLRRIVRTGATWSAWTAAGTNAASDAALAASSDAVFGAAVAPDGRLLIGQHSAGGWNAWWPEPVTLPDIPDRRAARLFVLGGEIVPDAADWPAMVSGGRVAARFADGVPAELARGRRVLIEANDGRCHDATVAAVTPAASGAGEADDHYLIDFTPPLPAPMAAARLHANVARASHGETQRDEVMGNGDGGQAFQQFALVHAPVTTLPGTGAALEVRVGGEAWTQVRSLLGCKSTERVYTTRRDAGGATTIGFGDGVTGARLPSGAANVVARYRTGLGSEGLVGAGKVAMPLERPPGLRAVINPFPTDGGVDPETLATVRTAAPATVRTFGRAVSLDDFARVAQSVGPVAAASATWVWHRLARAVHLTVAGAAGAALSDDALAALHAALGPTRDPHVALFIGNVVRLPVVVEARLLPDPAFDSAAVLADARARLLAAYAADVMPFARAVHASNAIALLAGARGVRAVDLDRFTLRGAETLTPAERAVRGMSEPAVQPHLRLFAARPTPRDPTAADRFARAGFASDGALPSPVLPAEQAAVLDPADVRLTIVEAL